MKKLKNKLCYLVDIVENNEICVLLQVKDNKKLDLIKLGCFDGNEELMRLTKGEDHTCTIFRTNDKPFSWCWGISGCTLVSDKLTTMGKLIEECITEDFDIYIGEDKNKIRETMNIMSLDDSNDISHSIEMMYWKDGEDVSVHKDNSFYKFFKNTIDAKNHFKNLNYDMDFKNKYIAETGCVVEEYDISKRKELEDWKEEPYFDLLTNLNEINDEDSFTIARVINGVNCVELHYVEGKATIEYGTRIKQDEWESTVEDIDWYNTNMTEEDISNKLWELFDYHYGEEYEI